MNELVDMQSVTWIEFFKKIANSGGKAANIGEVMSGYLSDGYEVVAFQHDLDEGMMVIAAKKEGIGGVFITITNDDKVTIEEIEE